MNRFITIALVLCIGGSGTVRADEPKPPWQRLLTGEDARKADGLNKRIEELEVADNYAEAIHREEELLALRTKVQGADHWETVNEQWALTALTKLAALPAEKRSGWQRIERTADEANRLERQSQYAKALPLREEYVKSCREILGEDHPYTTSAYRNVALNLYVQGKYTEAAPLFRKVLDIRRQILGEDHPDTAIGYSSLATNLNAQAKYAEAATLHQKALAIFRKTLGEDDPTTATAYNNLARTLNELGKYAEAEALCRKVLALRRKVLGEDHPETAIAYNNLAFNLQMQGQYAEAETLFRKALDINRRTLGENHASTALSYNNVAYNLRLQGKYTEAGPLFQQALLIRRQVLGEDHPDTAVSYNNIAYNLTAQGKNVEAAPLYQKALAIYRRTLGEEHPTTAIGYANVAHTLEEQGKYAEARPLYQKALDIRRQAQGEDNPTTAHSYSNLAINLQRQKLFTEAGPLFQKALDIRRRVFGRNHPDTAQSINNLATYLAVQGKYVEAEPLYQEALDIRRQVLGEDHPDTARSYNDLAVNLAKQGKYAEAGPFIQKGLDIHRQAEGEYHPDTANSYLNFAGILMAQGKYAEGLASLETAARSYEAARLRVAVGGLDRAVFGAEQSPYPLLAAARARAGRAAAAWEALEANLARGLLDEWAGRRGLGLSPDEQRQHDDLASRWGAMEARMLALVRQRPRNDAEAAELERLLGQRRQLEKSLAELATKVSRRQLATLAQLQAALPPDAAFVAWVDVNSPLGGVEEHWGCVVRPQGEPHWERLPGSGAGGTWTRTDSELSQQFSLALTQATPADDLAAVAKKLHAQRLAPLSKHLNGVKQLVVVPVQYMAGIPIEVLLDQYTVSYVPSGTYLARLQERQRPRGTGLLVVGDPIFPPVKDTPPATALPPGGLLIRQVLPGGAGAKARLQAGDVLVAYAGEDLTSVEQLGQLIAARSGEKTVVVKVWREGQENVSERELAAGRLGVAFAREPARQAITARRQADQLLARINRGDPYAELPGTQVEIARLAELFDPKVVTTLTRADASEQHLDELRRAGTLKQFPYLHFATHGKADNIRAFDSALILTPPPRQPEVRDGEPYLDGRLTAAEVVEFWQLDAELVTLSACESGLGKHGGGDGLLGFAQAFLLSGSRSVCLSLWQVDDTATALLMDRFYRNLLGKRSGGARPMSKAAALREAKEWLRTLPASEALGRLGTLTQGVVRGERPAREEMQAVPLPKDAPRDYRPYAHPRYWAAFILIGDPE